MTRHALTKVVLLTATAMLVFGLWSGATAAQKEMAGGKSLYQRLGGYDALAAVTDEFITRLAKDEVLGKFVVGLSIDSRKRLRQNVVDQMCQATGGPCYYVGRDMKTAHAGLGITEAHWNRSTEIFVGVLDDFKVPKAEKDEVLAIVSSLKPDIVTAR